VGLRILAAQIQRGFIEFRQGGTGPFEIERALLGQHHRAGRTAEQRHAQFLLQPGDGARGSSGGNPCPPRGVGKTEALGNANEQAQAIDAIDDYCSWRNYEM
jgi:hypothetical protein